MFVALLFPNIEVIEVGVSNFVTVDYASFSFPGLFFLHLLLLKRAKNCQILLLWYVPMMIFIKATFFLLRRGHELK